MPSDRGMGLRLIATETDCTVGAGDEVASERLRTYLRRLDVDSFCAADGPLAVRPGATSGRLPKRFAAGLDSSVWEAVGRQGSSHAGLRLER